jgi:hypothetical protein
MPRWGSFGRDAAEYGGLRPRMLTQEPPHFHVIIAFLPHRSRLAWVLHKRFTAVTWITQKQIPRRHIRRARL